jgi:hypothetical protein
MIPQFLEEMAHRHTHKRTFVSPSVLFFLAHGLDAWVLVFGKDNIVPQSQTEIWACLSSMDAWDLILGKVAHCLIPKHKSEPVSSQYFLANGLEAWDLILGMMTHLSFPNRNTCFSQQSISCKWVWCTRLFFFWKIRHTVAFPKRNTCLSKQTISWKWICCVRYSFGKHGTLSLSQTEIHACLSTIFPGKWIWCVKINFEKYDTLSYFSNKNSFLSQRSLFWQMFWMPYT